MRRRLAVFAFLGLGCGPALTDHAPVIVIPGRPGVPVIINGRDASYAVVEGDWGLARSIHVQPTVTWGWDTFGKPPAGRYFPSTGHRPGYGRLEVEPPPNRMLPPPAESFHRQWGSQPAPSGPVTEYPPFDPPQIIYGAPARRRPPQHKSP